MALKQTKELHDGLNFETIYLEDGVELTPEDQRQMYLEDLNYDLDNLHLQISDPDVFGPYLWDALNIIMLGMNDTNKRKQGAFLTALSDILPCGECATHLKEFLRFNPVDTQSRIRYAQYMLKLHNQVNKRNDKEERNTTKYVQHLINKYSLDRNNEDVQTEEEADTL